MTMFNPIVNPMKLFSAHDLNGLGLPYNIEYIDHVASIATTVYVYS